MARNCMSFRLVHLDREISQRELSSALSGRQNYIAPLSSSPLPPSLTLCLMYLTRECYEIHFPHSLVAGQQCSLTGVTCGSCQSFQLWWRVREDFSSLRAGWLIYFIACSQLHSSKIHHPSIETIKEFTSSLIPRQKTIDIRDVWMFCCL